MTKTDRIRFEKQKTKNYLFVEALDDIFCVCESVQKHVKYHLITKI